MSKKGTLRVATCQFAVSGNIKRNANQIRRQIAQAKKQRADVVHFSEACMTGYAGVEFKSWDEMDWDLLKEETESIQALARKKKIWVVLGSGHRLTGKHLPHNCLYIIDPRGRIVERYDKRFCTTGDLKFYSPGDHHTVFSINGVKCAALICYDVRFPELYRALKKRGVQLIFQSFYNARAKGPSVHTQIMRASIQCRAATNYFWISGNNSSGYYQSWPSILSMPNGRIMKSLPFHRAGVMVNPIDTHKKYYDASGPYRAQSMRGVLHNGRIVKDARSKKRNAI